MQIWQWFLDSIPSFVSIGLLTTLIGIIWPTFYDRWIKTPFEQKMQRSNVYFGIRMENISKFIENNYELAQQIDEMAEESNKNLNEWKIIDQKIRRNLRQYGPFVDWNLFNRPTENDQTELQSRIENVEEVSIEMVEVINDPDKVKDQQWYKEQSFALWRALEELNIKLLDELKEEGERNSEPYQEQDEENNPTLLSNKFVIGFIITFLITLILQTT